MDDDRRVPELEQAATDGDMKKVVDIVTGADFEGTHSDNASIAIQTAAEHGHWDIVKYLLETGVDVRENETGGHIVQYAALAGRMDVMISLLSCGATLSSRAGSNALLSAAATGQLEMVTWLADNGANVTTTGGEAALVAAKKDRWDIASFVVGAGADLARDSAGVQLLALASVQQQDDIVALLKDKGVDTQSNQCETALFQMSSTQEWDVCRDAVLYLVTHSANAAKSGARDTTLVTAAMYGDLEVVQLIIEKGCVDAKSSVAAGEGLAKAGLLAPPEEQELVKKYLEGVGAVAPKPPTLILDADF